MPRLLATLLLLPAAASVTAADDVVLNPGRHPVPNVFARLTPDGKTVVTVAADRCVRAWDADTGKRLAEAWLPDHHGDVPNRPVAWVSPDGTLAAVPYHTPEEPRGKFLLVPLAGPDVGTFRFAGGQDSDVEQAAFSPDGKRVATLAGWSVVVWDAATGKKVSEPKLDRDFSYSGLAFTPDGKRLSAFRVQQGYYEKNRSGVSTWNAETGKLANEMLLVRDGRPQLEWSPDGRQLAVGAGAGAVRFLLADGTLARVAGTPADHPHAGAFDSRRRYLAAWRRGDGYLIRDELGGKEVARLAGAKSVVGFSADGTRAATADDAGVVTVHDLADGKAISRFASGTPLPNAVGWGPGRLLAWGAGPAQYGGKLAPVSAALDLEKLELVKFDPNEITRRRGESDGVKLTDDGYRAKATAGGKGVPLEYEPEFDFGDIKKTTLVGRGHAVLVTGEGNGGYDTKTGKWVCGYPGGLWELAPSADGKLFAATDIYSPLIRVFRPGERDPVLTLFVSGDEWVAWTPKGAWASSPGGEGLAGTLPKAGPGKPRAFVPFAKEKRDPDAVKAALK